MTAKRAMSKNIANVARLRGVGGSPSMASFAASLAISAACRVFSLAMSAISRRRSILDYS